MCIENYMDDKFKEPKSDTFINDIIVKLVAEAKKCTTCKTEEDYK